ncbi:MAG: hypothetical protein RMZ42_06550 [Nostoc sp. DedQUE05]|uniref:TRAFAC clade GTPase domain-containing protein n=1 Tax=Nostoc sp. DedQUE05 TaxID=3075391 RepID=UPI002AD3D51C|nr:hypothetical protein [Nostoc sp. DedQUE05]MDZ8091584.1 hypothetical protein [Nostoc sp. DedQUE05]
MNDINLTNWENRLKDYGAVLSKWLKENLQTSSPGDIRLGIWGTSGAGKTTYLTMLYYALITSGKWLVEVDPKARKFIEENLSYIEEEGLFPPRTKPTKELPIYSYTLTPRSSPNSGSKIVLYFIDAPGEFYQNILTAKATVKENRISPSAKASEEEDKPMDIVDYLISCDGIIFLLDPERSEKDGLKYSTLLRKLFLEFQERCRRAEIRDPRLEQYITFCVTKVDRQDFWSNRKTAQQFVEKILGIRMPLTALQGYCRLELNPDKRKRLNKDNRCEFFSVSSLGCYQKDGEWKSPVIYPEENDSSQSDTQHTNSSDGNYDWDSYNDVYAPETPSSSSSTDDWTGNNSNNKNNSESPPQSLPKINPEAILVPLNVIEPVEWLIEGIQAHPPSRITRKSPVKD